MKAIFAYGTLRPDMTSLVSAWMDIALKPPVPLDLSKVHYGEISGLTMYASGYSHPMCIEGGAVIHGQYIDLSYLTDEQWDLVLGRLDQYEGHPSLFKRELYTITLEDGTTREAWVYLYQYPEYLKASTVVPHGDWKLWCDQEGES